MVGLPAEELGGFEELGQEVALVALQLRDDTSALGSTQGAHDAHRKW
jgi:hypothetical protein